MMNESLSTLLSDLLETHLVSTSFSSFLLFNIPKHYCNWIFTSLSAVFMTCKFFFYFEINMLFVMKKIKLQPLSKHGNSLLPKLYL